MSGLQRFRGHFYNWYDTRDLRPLEPQYVSSVDSGNLAGHLIALANACREWRRRPTAGLELVAGIEDALHLTRESLHGLPDDRRTQTITRQQLGDALDALAAALRSAPMPSEAIGTRLAEARAARRNHGRHGPYARERARRRCRRRDAVLGRGDARIDRESPPGRRNDRRRRPRHCRLRLAALETTARAMAGAMEFGFLLDPERKLLSIGYRVADGTLDPSCYDLLASEARLASFVAIAKGDVPTRHWFRLGRAVTPIGRGAALISWSGSMFEYLMPSLVMRAPAGSLLEQTSRLVVRRQIDYGAALGVPWGISESAYNVRDLELTYQYSNFGVPGLGSEARSRRERRRRALRHGARGHGRSRSGGAQLRPPRRDRRARPLRLLRGARLHAHAPARRRKTSRSCAPSWRTTRA